MLWVVHGVLHSTLPDLDDRGYHVLPLALYLATSSRGRYLKDIMHR